MTLADYAHRSAYPLILTALFAGLFVLVFLRPGSATAKVPTIRRLVTAWIAQNLFLVASSILRTVDYVEAYSLTVLRLSALLWMALVAVGLVLVLVRLLRERSAGWLINANLAAAGLLLGATCFVDLSATTAWWNLRHAREFDGDGAALDLCYMNELGASALLPLVAIERGTAASTVTSADLRARAQQVRRQVMVRTETEIRNSGGSLLDRWRLAKARQRLGFSRSAMPVDGYGCDGAGD
jgi:hypothetical protein